MNAATGRPSPTMPSIEPVAAIERRPFWSVMIPCFNDASLLARALHSVLVQDPGMDAMQIEVVDDSSTLDDPAEVVERLGHGRVGYFRQPRNVGVSANFTTCVRRSTGRWVHLLHSDDMVLPDFYARYRERIEACPAAHMVAAQTIMTDAAERHLGVTYPLEVHDGYVRDAAFTIAAAHPLRCVSVVVARRIYERAGGFHPALFHANDWEMWSRVASLGPVAWVDQPLGLYRSHPDSDTNRLHSSTSYLDDCLQAAELIAGYFEDPEVRRRVRRGANRVVGDYAVGVGLDLVARGWYRLAAINGVRAARIDPTIHTCARALEVVGLAIAGRLAPWTAQLKRPVASPGR